MLDKFNQSESLVVSFLAADSDLTAMVKKFHEKILDDIFAYNINEVPAIAVHSIAFEPDETFDRLQRVRVYIEIVHCGGDLQTVDTLVKQITDLVIDKLRLESPTNEGDGLSGNFDVIEIKNFNIVPVPDNTQYRVVATGEILLGFISKLN